MLNHNKRSLHSSSQDKPVEVIIKPRVEEEQTSQEPRLTKTPLEYLGLAHALAHISRQDERCSLTFLVLNFHA